MSENIFSHSYINCMENERVHEEEQFHFKNYLLGMPHFHATEKCTTRTELCNGKTYNQMAYPRL